ncbi:hypothetical protein [Pseudorhodoplanes sp.]|uniref:hypothetical protein n=1 Tax=Pseudorhodoplanes sp. TaxID=1934341 RepID=UPI002C16D0E6|nr:hypothetical protein [Pseudorhodoplanes sp.]HWV51159.1 hypothetical protein [Pseudorhodoplanes sp.]
MNRSFAAARGVIVFLAFLVLGLAALMWWLFDSGRLQDIVARLSNKPPVEQARPAAPAPSPAPEKSASRAITEANQALKDLGDRLAPSAPATTDAGPSFDVARVEQDGEAVIAGRAAPGSSVELLVSGQVHDRTTADASGAFVFVPKPLPPGSYDITLRATRPDGTVMVSKSAVAVTLRAKDAPAVATLSTPKAPVATPQVASPATPQSKPRDDVATKPASKDGEIRIETIRPEDNGGLFVSGRAAPGAQVRLYMNDGYIATGTVSPEGRVSFSIRSGVRAGDYRIRLEQMNAAETVVSHVETPFRVTASMAAVTPSAPQAPQAPQAPAASESTATPKQAELGPATKAAVASPAQSPSATNDKTALVASGPSQVLSPSRSAATEPAPKAVSEPAKAPVGESAKPVQAASPAVPAGGPVVQRDKSDASVSQPSAQKPVTATSPVVPSTTRDRRDTVVVPSIETKLIVRGDNLWRISHATYGLGQRYTLIFGANRDKIRNPHLIYPGQIFVLPNASPKQ